MWGASIDTGGTARDREEEYGGKLLGRLQAERRIRNNLAAAPRGGFYVIEKVRCNEQVATG